ncbi:hypothetical protein [Albidovulum aquaemixtae]|uniref:hypothetical protein n=1 Tax=Albidovulum aquaemixtae TaxID=1542388 RepID=UPI0011B1F3FF|nr:hypothetical protein [Defluviimonas aquaemixtae]
MRTINPTLFARLMRLPAPERADLLEFVGATRLDDAHLSAMIEDMAVRIDADRRSLCTEPN